jgi:hypothetical protein
MAKFCLASMYFARPAGTFQILTTFQIVTTFQTVELANVEVSLKLQIDLVTYVTLVYVLEYAEKDESKLECLLSDECTFLLPINLCNTVLHVSNFIPVHLQGHQYILLH